MFRSIRRRRIFRLGTLRPIRRSIGHVPRSRVGTIQNIGNGRRGKLHCRTAYRAHLPGSRYSIRYYRTEQSLGRIFPTMLSIWRSMLRTIVYNMLPTTPILSANNTSTKAETERSSISTLPRKKTKYHPPIKKRVVPRMGTTLFFDNHFSSPIPAILKVLSTTLSCRQQFNYQ